jgi:hypothetical protein
MYIDSRHHEPALTGLLRVWLRSNSSWHMRQDWPEEDDTQFAVYWLMPVPTLRQASADEIAADILNDPALREALGFLASAEGQTIEDAVMRLWLPGWQAQLLTAALTRAWQTVLNQNRPIWQRTEVLVGASIGAVALLAWASRGKS